ncbi:hypothetical protein SGFS_007280 [Streptomyces graminofaciens]|jgi:hypothetical protein|uniref:Uncharacterized protein n=2 Tax=Streptomyces graminofaciens TaxID=68212 RepID=A0ABM7F1F1_9ACTN|nr:hypothetical protein SGFS_007280 [Streptomyces graminofaciens]
MDLGLFPDGRLSLTGAAADFHLLDAEGIPDAPPDYSERRLSEVRGDLPWWDSECTVLKAATTGGK